VADRGIHRSHRMQGLPPEGKEPPQNPSNEGMVEEITSETGSVAPGSDQHTEEPVTTFVEGMVPHTNPPLTDPLGPLLIEQPSMTYFDAYSSYHFLSSTTRKYFGMNPPTFDFTLGISPPLSTTLVVDPARAQSATVGASSLLGTFVTQVTLTQPLENTSLFAHGSR
jgi:hypothetical protein